MRFGNGLGLGLVMLLAGCGAQAPVALMAPASADAAPSRVSVAPLGQAPSESTASVLVSFQNPRTSFSSDKIELSSGKTLPVDDGMGPEGDISFFFDGSRFQVLANASGGANRMLAPARSERPVEDFAMAPVALQANSEVLVKSERGTYVLRITDLEAGSMKFDPTGIGTGTGSVSFSYRLVAM